MAKAERQLLFSITRGYQLDISDLTEKQIAELEAKIHDNDMVDADGTDLEQEAETTHYEGTTWVDAP